MRDPTELKRRIQHLVHRIHFSEYNHRESMRVYKGAMSKFETIIRKDENGGKWG